MSKLLDLLNPAPTDPPSDSPTLPQPVEVNLDRQVPHNRHPSITSPLEALAIAATSSPSVLSPIHAASPSSNTAGGHQRTFSSASSRQDSNHITLPSPHNLPQPFSPHFDIQNFSLGAPTRPADSFDTTSHNLPPLRSLVSDGMDASGAPLPVTSSSALDQIQPAMDGHSALPASARDATSFNQDSSNHKDHNTNLILSPLTSVANGLEHNIEHQPTPAQLDTETNPPAKDTKTDTETNPPVRDTKTDAEGQTNMDSTMDLASQTEITPSAPQLLPVKRESSVASQQADPKPKPKLKKGTSTAIKKPTTKKRKFDAESNDGTPFSQRSGTPTSSRASKTPAPRTQRKGSIMSMQSSPAPAVHHADTHDDESMDDDTAVFCICRKPDDHTWMIGCDGGCEDWFHGRCVDMNERDGNLVDKWICPNCAKPGIRETTWKPMCRLETCREPARVKGPKPSKYCCDDHGEQYMAQHALGKERKRNDTSKASANKKRRRDNHTDHFGNGDDDYENGAEQENDDQAYLRGGILHAGELKTLTSGVNNVEEFQSLGDGVPTPPQIAGKNQRDIKHEDNKKANVVYTAEESAQLEVIAVKKASLKRKRDALDDKEKILGLVKSRAKMVLETLKQKDGIKDLCGYDSRLTWSDEEFDNWRSSSEGMQALASGVLGPPTSTFASGSANKDSMTAEDDDQKMVNGFESQDGDLGQGICQKKRCERHKAWYKLQVQGIAFERNQCEIEMAKLEREEEGMGERAGFRSMETSHEMGSFDGNGTKLTDEMTPIRSNGDR